MGAATVGVLNGMGIERITSVFKYLNTLSIVLLFAVHFASVCLSFTSVIGGVRKAVFAKAKRVDDIDLPEMEVDEV